MFSSKNIEHVSMKPRWNWEKLNIIDKWFSFLYQETLILQHPHQWNGKVYFSFFLFDRFFPWSMYLQTAFLWYIEKSNFKQKISTRVASSKEDQSSSKYYVTRKDFKFWPKITFSKNYEPITVWLRLVYKITIFVGFIQTQKSYPTSFDKVITPWEISQFCPEALVNIISESCKTHRKTCVI